MKKLDAIRKILDSEKVDEATKLTGITQVVVNDEDIAATIAETYTKPSVELRARMFGGEIHIRAP